MNAKVARALLVTAVVATGRGWSALGDGEWQKPGADAQMINRDSTECREAAQEEAIRRYPYRASSPALGTAGIGLGQQRDDHNRSVAEASMFNNCMRGRGYKR